MTDQQLEDATVNYWNHRMNRGTATASRDGKEVLITINQRESLALKNGVPAFDGKRSKELLPRPGQPIKFLRPPAGTQPFIATAWALKSSYEQVLAADKEVVSQEAHVAPPSPGLLRQAFEVSDDEALRLIELAVGQNRGKKPKPADRYRY